MKCIPALLKSPFLFLRSLRTRQNGIMLKKDPRVSVFEIPYVLTSQCFQGAISAIGMSVAGV